MNEQPEAPVGPSLPRTVRMVNSLKLTLLCVPSILALVALLPIVVSFASTMQQVRLAHEAVANGVIAALPPGPGPWTNFRLVVLVFGGVFGVVVSLFFVAFGARYVRERHLMRWGLATSGQILSQKSTYSYRYGSTADFTVRYRFQAEVRRPGDGSRAVLPFQGWTQRRKWAALDAATWRRPIILYDPKKPSRNMLFPPATVTCDNFSPDREGVPDPQNAVPVPTAARPADSLGRR